MFRRRGPSSPPAATRPDADRERSHSSVSDDLHDWRGYDFVAEEYERVMAPRLALPGRDLVAAVAPEPGGRLLDVGTGTGVVARAAWEAMQGQGVVVGVDASEPMLLRARGVGGGPRYASAVAIDLPFRSATFDAVTGSFVLSHFTRFETALFDMLRVLRPGGRLGVTSWARGDDAFSTAWMTLAEEVAGRRVIQDARRRAMPWDEHFADPLKLKEALYEAGLRDILIEHREYRFQMSGEDYVASRELAATGRFLRQMLGDRLWDRFQERSRAEFARAFPPSFNDFRDVNIAVATKPAP